MIYVNFIVNVLRVEQPSPKELWATQTVCKKAVLNEHGVKPGDCTSFSAHRRSGKEKGMQSIKTWTTSSGETTTGKLHCTGSHHGLHSLVLGLPYIHLLSLSTSSATFILPCRMGYLKMKPSSFQRIILFQHQKYKVRCGQNFTVMSK